MYSPTGHYEMSLWKLVDGYYFDVQIGAKYILFLLHICVQHSFTLCPKVEMRAGRNLGFWGLDYKINSPHFQYLKNPKEKNMIYCELVAFNLSIFSNLHALSLLFLVLIIWFDPSILIVIYYFLCVIYSQNILNDWSINLFF